MNGRSNVQINGLSGTGDLNDRQRHHTFTLGNGDASGYILRSRSALSPA